MKVLKDNYNNNNVIEENINQIKPYPRDLICENCGSELEYEESDVYIGALGCAYLKCPCCNNENMLEENEHSIDLTKDNVEFPMHFFHTSVDTGAVDCCNNEKVKNAIYQAIDYFRKNKEKFAWTTECGNLYMNVFRYEGDENYYVVVSNDYYSTYIPFESVDY